MISPKDISEKKFEKSKVFGYKTSEVDDFMKEICKDYEMLYAEKNKLEEKVNFLAEKLAEYREQENKLTDVLLEAKKVSDNVIKKAKEKANIILSDAEMKSNKMLTDAKKEFEKEQFLFLKLQRETTNFKNKILALYKSHIDLIATLPSDNLSEDNTAYQQEQQDKEAVKDDLKLVETYDQKKKMKERTFSISLDKNGRPIDVKDDTISDTKNISLARDMRKVTQLHQVSEDNKNIRFKEPLRFGSNYNLNSKLKKK